MGTPATVNITYLAGGGFFSLGGYASLLLLDAGLVNWGTFAGAACFAVGGALQAFDTPTSTRTVVQHTP